MFFNFFIIVFTYFFIWFAVAVWKRDFSLFDIAWGGGLFLPIAYGYLNRISPSTTLLVLLMFLWALRLTLHIAKRHGIAGKDRRYLEMVKNWGRFWIYHGFFKVYILQATLACLIIVPEIYFVISPPGKLSIFSWIGFLLSLSGLLAEMVADYQLNAFKSKRSNGYFLQEGLWKYSRHPNYVGEVIFWWGLWIFCLPVVSIWTFVGPLTIYILLRYVSGVPPLENHWMKNPEFKEYAEKVPIFWPF